MEWTWVLNLFCIACLCLGQPDDDTAQRVELLRRKAYSAPEGSSKRLAAWQEILKIEPNHLEAHVSLGWQFISMPGYQERGIEILERVFDPTKVEPSLNLNFPQSVLIAATVGRYRSQKKEYLKAFKYTEIAFQASKMHTPGGDVCLQMQLASMLDYFPKSTSDADASLVNMNHQADALLAREDWNLDEDILSASVPGAANDPYVHCLLSIFTLSFYYRADTAATAARHYEMAAKAWPDLNYVAPHVLAYAAPSCVQRKIRLGIFAGVLSEGHPVSEDFGGVLSNLDRDIFEVSYIYLYESGDPELADFTKRHSADKTYVLPKLPTDEKRGAWPRRLGEQIAQLQLDMILYLDLTMSTHARRLGMQRLAPVQLNTHGHPVTSGHPSSIVQYFVSWAEAEVPSATEHYTEDLLLIPKGTIHQYYHPRTLPGQRSRMDGLPYGHLTRADFDLPGEVSLYLCMQKPFKVGPEFDTIICGILQQDPEGHVVLHRETSPLNQGLYEERLRVAGCDFARVDFIDGQPHHRLLALYRESTVVLDSYPAGGCTTTREVLEMGKAVVTLPARLLGGRWTLGYYNILGLDNETKQALIASTEQEYMDLAVALGTNQTLRERVEASIIEAVAGLFHREEAVEAWQRILLSVSPVQQCQPPTATEQEL